MLIDRFMDDRDIRSLPATAEGLERAGCDGIFMGESSFDPLVRVALVAEHTSRATVGTAVVVALPRSPTHVAYAAHDLQAISGGRFLLGLGSQVGTHLNRRFSVEGSRPAPRMREFVLSIRAIWANWYGGEALDYRGEVYCFTLMPATFTPTPSGYGPPPVWLAGVGEHMTMVAGEVADGFFLHPFTSPRFVEQYTNTWLEAGRKRGTLESPPSMGLPAMVAVGESPQTLREATDAVRAQVAFYASTPAYRGVLAVHGWSDVQPELQRLSREGRWDSMGSLVDDSMLQTFACIGSPDTVAEQLTERWSGSVDRIAIYTPGYAPSLGTLERLVAGVRSRLGAAVRRTASSDR